MTGPDSKREKILVSACLISKDEENYLGSCLNSLRDLVDEVVIGDTGSTDKSVQVAREHGAFVFEIPWKENFAAARNAVIDRAHGQWILTIDADERLRSFSKTSLFSAFRDPSKWAFYSLLCHKKDWTPYWALRLFRNDRRIRYRGRIHENIREDLDRILISEGGEVGYADMVLEHFGYEGNQVHKYRRNLPLVRHELRTDPENTNLIRHLGLIHYKLGRITQAEMEWKRAVRLIANKEALEPVDSLAFSYLIESLQNRGKPARRFLDAALKVFPENPQLYCLNARELLAEGRFAPVIPYLHQLLRWGEDKNYARSIPYHTRIFDAYPHAYLAVCLLMLGRLEESRLHCDVAFSTDPGNLKIERMLRPLIALYSHTDHFNPASL
jgi:glycosyltransferase involved in cell wall biosynthesis